MDPNYRLSLLPIVVILLLTMGSLAMPFTVPSRHASSGNEAVSFTEVAVEKGLTYQASGTDAASGYQITHTNEGVYVADINNDLYPDLLAIGGSRPILYENTGGRFRATGDLRSVDQSIKSALFLDYDNDRWQDLLLFPLGGTPIFFENERGTLTRRDIGIDIPLAVPVSAAAADYNGDGCLDVFIVQNGNWSDRLPVGFTTYDVPEGSDNGNPNVLLRGNCSSFERVEEAGIRGERWSLATSFVDFTGDGRPDIHVANDFNRDVLYINEGNGSFERRELGSATNRNGMASEIADFDYDGRPDILVTNIYFPHILKQELRTTTANRSDGNNLLLNRGDGHFIDTADRFGLRRGGWGWGVVFADLDNDMFGDVFQATQVIKFGITGAFPGSFEPTIREHYPYYRYPAVWRGTSDGFESLNASRLGIRPSDGRGVAQFDFDRDGDLDIVLADVAGQFKLYENSINDTHAFQLRLRSERRPEFGARVYVTVNNRTRVRYVNSRTGFLSQEPSVLHFGTGGATEIDRVRIVWATGRTQVFTDLHTDHLVTITPQGIVDRKPLG